MLMNVESTTTTTTDVIGPTSTMEENAPTTEENTEEYVDASDNDLNVYQAACLLMADCLGTGILALPADIAVLGKAFGFAFLIFQLPVNLYAGTILSKSATHVEATHRLTIEDEQITEHKEGGIQVVDRNASAKHAKASSPNPVPFYESISRDRSSERKQGEVGDPVLGEPEKVKSDEPDGLFKAASAQQAAGASANRHPVDLATFDFIGMTQALMSTKAVGIVMAVYYVNIFLVLGDYILVMSHAVTAMLGEDRICLPTAGIFASSLMFVVTQIRTMANLGRSISIMSLTALAIVIVQCLVALYDKEEQETAEFVEEEPPSTSSPLLLSKFSAMASIGFAVGSQKLFLNIRHEMTERERSPKSLGIALTMFGWAYVVVCWLANQATGPDATPPSFLLDAIPEETLSRRLAGFFLWVHVVVSYAINSQAICSSFDRLFFYKVFPTQPQFRWTVLTMVLAVSSYLVANAVPFFKDLVALIGALTSVPLTLLMPALFYRKLIQTRFLCCCGEPWSAALVAFSVAYLLVGLVGALHSIQLDWENHGPPFSCH